MQSARIPDTSTSAPSPPSPPPPAEREAPFSEIYRKNVRFVWRNVRRLGVPDTLVDDAVQEVFLTVHRRLHEFEGRSSLRTWIFGIAAHVAGRCRRTLRRRDPSVQLGGRPIEADAVADEQTESPHDHAIKLEGVRLLHKLLDEVDDEKRAVLVLVELEQISVPDIAEALGINVNTVYARLRAARLQFEQAVTREKARDSWRLG